MAKKKKPAPVKTGASRMRQLGWKRVECWFRPEAFVVLERAAELVGSALSVFVEVAARQEAHLTVQRHAMDQHARK